VDIIRIRKIPLLIDDIPNLLYTGACIHEEMNYSIILNESWDNYYSLRKSKIKADSKRRTKLLSEKGRLRFYVPSNKEEMIDLTKVMIQQKEARYKHKKFNNQFRDVENINFYSEATKNFPDGTPHLSALLLDNKIIAIHWGLVYDNRFYHIMPAHDHEWSKYAPGRLLLQNLIEWSFENKLEYFDFTCGDEIYKKDWSNIERSLYEYRQVLSLKARLFLYVFSKIELLKIVIKKNKTLFERPFAAFKGTARNN
jgi:CelD/BcsL family acetyltransferase involved in cellulose biosynthesis